MAGAPPVSPKVQFTSSTGAPLANGTVTVYLAGTTTLTDTWQDKDLTVLNTNPITLDSRGEALVWLDTTKTYKFLLKNAGGATQWTVDNITTTVAFATTEVDQFVGTGSQVAFTLGSAPGSLNNLTVVINGLQMKPTTDYTVSGTTLTFTTAPALSDEIMARYGRGITPGAATDANDVAYQPSGSGAVARTAQAKLRESVSVKDFGAVGDGVTSDQVAVAAAVAAAYAAGDDLYWPDGTYLTTASISNFHSVRHVGPGAVKRGSEVFYVQPNSSQTNKLYIATTGSASNDGLSSSEPFATFQGCFDATKNYGPTLGGFWQLIAAAGTYDFSSGQQTFGTPSVNRVVIRGPVAGHPNVPTCIIDGGGNGATYRHGLSASGAGVVAEFRDIRAEDFTDTSGNTRIGFVGENAADIYTNNCHTFACSWTGIYVFSVTRARISGGIVDGNNISSSQGITTNDAEATIGYQSASTATAPIIKNCTSTGIYWSRGSQGHVDYATIQDCGIGVTIEQGGSVAIPGVDLKRNTVGIRVQTGANYREDGVPVVFNHGTADANTTPVEYFAFSGNGDELRVAQSYARFGYDRTTRSASGITSGTFPTIYTIPAYRLDGAGKSCRVHVKGIYTVTAGSSITVNFGGMALALTVAGAATSVAFELDVELLEVSGGYRAIGRLSHGLSAHRFGSATAGFDKTAASAVSVGYNLTGAGDSLNIYRTDVYLIG